MNKRIAIVAHKYLPQIDDDFVSYLDKDKYYIFHIKHSFSDTKNRCSVFDKYVNSNPVKEYKTINYMFLPEVLIYLKEFIYTSIWLVNIKRIDVYIGMDGLCTLFGLFLKYIGIVRKVIYWSVDFVPVNRFGSNFKDTVYNYVNTLSCKQADEVWDLSPRMVDGRKKYFNLNINSYKHHKVVPNGIWLDRIKTIDYSKCEENTLVFMGHLLKKQGVDMVIRSIPKIIKEIPDFKFKIIGDGNFRSKLEGLADKMSVSKYCYFLGRLSNEDLENEISISAVAIAPYIVSPDSYTYYADPGKIKTYLACGVPVLMTKLPWNAKEIEKKRCGLIIKDNGSDLIEKLIYLMTPKTNKKFRINAIKYSKDFNFNKIFTDLNI